MHFIFTCMLQRNIAFAVLLVPKHCFCSLIGTQTFRRCADASDNVGGQMPRHKKCQFSVIISSGWVWRKVLVSEVGLGACMCSCVYIYVCVCVCVCVMKRRKRERTVLTCDARLVKPLLSHQLMVITPATTPVGFHHSQNFSLSACTSINNTSLISWM